jgi:hypothetical protein
VAAHCLIEAAEQGAVAFPRIGMLRAMKQQADRAPTLELVELTMRKVQQLKTDHVDPISRDREASGVMEIIVAIVSSPAPPVKSSDPTSTQRERERAATIKPTDDRCLIASEILQSR